MDPTLTVEAFPRRATATEEKINMSNERKRPRIEILIAASSTLETTSDQHPATTTDGIIIPVGDVVPTIPVAVTNNIVGLSIGELNLIAQTMDLTSKKSMSSFLLIKPRNVKKFRIPPLHITGSSRKWYDVIRKIQRWQQQMTKEEQDAEIARDITFTSGEVPTK
jgi:hypothetical protein